LYPATPELAFQKRLTLYCVAVVVPVPVSGMVTPGPAANRLPPCVAAVSGVKVTLTVTLCPGLRAKGREGPLNENPLPIVWNVEMVVRCELVSTTGTVELVPIATEPNDTIEGLAVKDVLPAPVPSIPSTRVSLEASLEKLILPPVHPIAVGAKLTLKSKLCPAGTINGRFKLDGVKVELLTANPERVTLVPPLFVTVTIMVLVCPTTTSPKRRIQGEQVSCGAAALALTGAMTRRKIPMLIVRRLTARSEGDWMIDWGTRITPSLGVLGPRC
jgi:hypothetical protein